MPKRNFTQELLAKRDQGYLVVISLAPHQGVPVEYKPRSSHDPQPWDAGLSYRFTGRECHAIKAVPASRLDRDLFLRNIQRRFDGSFQMGQDDYGFDFTRDQAVRILANLVSDGMLDRYGDTYVTTERGYARLASMSEDAA